MERVKFVIVVIFVSMLCCPSVHAADMKSDMPAQVVVHPAPTDCVKTFQIPFDKLFYLTLAATNEFDYVIKEIQSKSGYIIFETGYRKYLASIVYVSSDKSILKITPYSGNYDFPACVVKNMFEYVDKYKEQKY